MERLSFTAQVKRLEALAARQATGLLNYQAVFDLGTRASRLLVGPLDSGRVLRRNHIATVSMETFLGHARPAGSDVLAFGPEIEKLTAFLRDMTATLKRLNLPSDRIRAVGTAAFRSIANQAEVLDFIRTKSGVDVDVLDERYEARLSLLSVYVNFRKRSHIQEGDYVLLIDQGGGSTEISFTRFRREGFPSRDEMHATSLRLGTLSLAADALAGGSVENAADEQEIVRAQFERVEIATRGALTDVGLFAEPLKGRRIHTFGMGSAITKMTRGNVWQINGVTVRRQDMLARLSHLRTKYATTPLQTVSQSADFVQVYGLPVFISIMKTVGARKITICGFGLRFGVLYESVFGLRLG